MLGINLALSIVALNVNALNKPWKDKKKKKTLLLCN
jgi:hypothetical protein